MELFARLNRERGQTVILVSHAPEAAAFAQRVLSLRDGELHP